MERNHTLTLGLKWKEFLAFTTALKWKRSSHSCHVVATMSKEHVPNGGILCNPKNPVGACSLSKCIDHSMVIYSTVNIHYPTENRETTAYLTLFHCRPMMLLYNWFCMSESGEIMLQYRLCAIVVIHS